VASKKTLCCPPQMFFEKLAIGIFMVAHMTLFPPIILFYCLVIPSPCLNFNRSQYFNSLNSFQSIPTQFKPIEL
jgi:hypothetical protein